MGGPQSGDCHLIMRQTFNSLWEEHPDPWGQQNISKSHNNRLYRDNDGISQKCKTGLSHRISALLFLALGRDILKKKQLNVLKNPALFLFWCYKETQGEEGIHLLLSGYPILYLKISAEHFPGKFCSTMLGKAAISAYLRMRCILRNLSVALLLWGSGKKTFFCSSGLCKTDVLPFSGYCNLLLSLSALICSMFTFTWCIIFFHSCLESPQFLCFMYILSP